MEDDAKLKAILGGSVGDGVAGLAKLTRDELTALHDMEAKGKKRSTMLSAIDAALKALPEDTGGGDGASGGEAQQPASLLQRVVGAVTGGSGEQMSNESAAGDNAPVTYTQAQVDAMLAQQRDTQAAMFTREQVDQMIAERETFHAAEKDRAVAEAKGTTAATVKVDVPDALAIVLGADSPALAVLTGASSIVFVDGADRALIGLPAMTFTGADFDAAGAAVTLKVEVEFPKEIPATEVAGAFLLDGEDEPVGKATLVMPFAIGGGKTTRLAKSTLQFAA